MGSELSLKSFGCWRMEIEAEPHKDGEKSKAFIENPPHVFLTQQQTMTADLLQL